MNCREAQRSLPGYLDGAIRARDRVLLREHLDTCEPCRQQLAGYRSLAAHLANVKPVDVPAGLAAQIRAQASEGRSPWAFVNRLWVRALLVSQNILEPLAVPATGGVLTAVAVFMLVVQSMLVGMPIGRVEADDLPLNLVQPAQLESLAPFPVPGINRAEGQADSGSVAYRSNAERPGRSPFLQDSCWS